MQVDIYTDCSFCPNTNRASYACAIVSLHLSSVKYISGIINGTVSSSTLAELIAIAEGIEYAKQLHKKVYVTNFIITTDSKGAIAWIKAGEHYKYDVQKTLQRINRIKEKGFTVTPVWVPAHKYGGKMKTTFNNKVDKLAKKLLREYLQEQKQTTKYKNYAHRNT